jgi:hypothetical protein
MKKKFIFIISLLIFALPYHKSYALFDLTAISPETARAGIKALKDAGFSPQNIAKHIKPLTTDLRNIGIESSKKIAKAVKKVAIFGTKATYVAGGYVCVLAVREARTIGGSIKNYFYPDAKKLKEKQEQDFFAARKTLEDLLKKNSNGKIGSMGIPEACEESARAFALMPGGKDELQNIIDTFKKYFTMSSGKKHSLVKALLLWGN